MITTARMLGKNMMFSLCWVHREASVGYPGRRNVSQPQSSQKTTLTPNAVRYAKYPATEAPTIPRNRRKLHRD
jgi:hypothetical protein